MVKGIKVSGQANLVRSSSIPGLILSNNAEAARAALQARVKQEQDQQIIDEQQIQITQMQMQIQALMQHVGVPESLTPEKDEGTDNGQ